MKREVVLDTETTGLSARKGDRIIEIGAIELIDHAPTGEIYHQLIQPDRNVPADAVAIHGITDEQLAGKPRFEAIASDVLEFIDGATLIIHNAMFDVGFLDMELTRAGRPTMGMARVIDTMAIAKRKFPNSHVSLDALCLRFGIDLSRREKHNAVLDCELLAEVYLELIGARQTRLSFDPDDAVLNAGDARKPAHQRPEPLPSLVTPEEDKAHRAFIAEMGEDALWRRYLDREESP